MLFVESGKLPTFNGIGTVLEATIKLDAGSNTKQSGKALCEATGTVVLDMGTSTSVATVTVKVSGPGGPDRASLVRLGPPITRLTVPFVWEGEVTYGSPFTVKVDVDTNSTLIVDSRVLRLMLR